MSGSVLVTGASGLLGARVAEQLSEQGRQVVTFQRRPCPVPGVAHVAGDVTERADWDRALSGGVEAVIHLAARVGTEGTAEEFTAVNVGGTRHLLAAMAAHGVGRLVHVSSPSVAHTGQPLVAAGADAARPEAVRGHYSRTKALAELEVLAATGIERVVVRPHLVWGPGDTQLVGRIVERARAGRLGLVGAGTALIDTTYIDDAAAALVAALDAVGRVGPRPLMVAGGDPRPVAELVERICRAAGVPFEPRRLPTPVAGAAGWAIETIWRRARLEGEPPLTRFVAEQLGTAHWFDLAETRRLLDWEPRVGVEEGMERLAAWFAAR